MAGPWENYQPQPALEPQSDGPWAQYAAQTAAAPTQVYSGSILPIGKDSQGNVSFDSNAGLLGILKRALTGAKDAVELPGDVYSGKTQINGPDGSVSPDVIHRSADLAAIASPVSAVSRSGFNMLGEAIPPKMVSVAPTPEALKAAAGQGYNQARELGVELGPQSLGRLGETISASLGEKGVNGELAPKTFSILGRLKDPPPGSVVTVSNLDTVRRALGHAAKDFANPTEQLAARTAQSHLDDYMAAIPSEDVIRGPASEASKILSEARGNFAAAKRAGQITDAVDAADISAAAANSGQNAGNAARQRIKSILLSDKKSAGYSPDEIAQMERVVRGTRVGNAARYAGNLLGGGGGLGAVASAAVGGAATAHMGGIGAVAPVVGYAMKKASDASVNKQIKILEDLILSRSPLGRTPVALPSSGVNPTKEAIVRSLLMSPQQQ